MFSLNFSSQCGHEAIKSNMEFPFFEIQKKREHISDTTHSFSFFFTSSSTKGRNPESMPFALTNMEWHLSFVIKRMMLGSMLLTVNTSPLSMFLNISPALITVFPLFKTVRVWKTTTYCQGGSTRERTLKWKQQTPKFKLFILTSQIAGGKLEERTVMLVTEGAQALPPLFLLLILRLHGTSH